MPGLSGINPKNNGSRSKIAPILLDRLANFIGLFFSSFLSGTLVNNFFYGGALFVGGQLLLLLSGILGKKGAGIPKRERYRYIIYAPVIVLCLVVLLLQFPVEAGDFGFLLLFLTMQFTIFYLFSGPPVALFQIRKHERILPYYILGLLALLHLAWGVPLRIKLYVITYMAIIFVLELFKRLLSGGSQVNAADFEFKSLSGMMGMKGNSFRLYRVMVTSTHITLDISMLILVCFLFYHPMSSIWLQLGNIMLFVVLYCLAALLSQLILKGRILSDLGKNSIFMIFSIIWIVTIFYLYRNSGQGSYTSVFSYLLLCVCLSSLIFISFSMDNEMRIVAGLDGKHITDRDYQAAKTLLSQWSMFFSRFIMLLILGALSLLIEYNPSKMSTIRILDRYGLVLLPAILLVPGSLAALKQPLNKAYEQKLKKYSFLKVKGVTNTCLEDRLRLVLVEKYSKRIGILILKSLLKPLFKHRVIGRENVDAGSLPAVFVCNHSEIYGPVASVLNMPYYFKPWILNEMVDINKISGHIQQGTFDRQKWIPRPIRSRMGRFAGPVVAWMMQSMEPIPVYRDNGRQVLKAIHLSVEALEADDNILIFPENPLVTDGYLREGVGEFFSGFVNIAREYYKKTSRAITFYAIFANKNERTLSFSKGITYDPSKPFPQEKKKITRFLHETMTKMSKGNHTVN